MTHDDLVKGENCFFSRHRRDRRRRAPRRPLRGRARRDHRVAGHALAAPAPCDGSPRGTTATKLRQLTGYRLRMSRETVLAERLGRLPARVQRRLSRAAADHHRRPAPRGRRAAHARAARVLGQPVWDDKLDVETARRLTREEAAVAARHARRCPSAASRTSRSKGSRRAATPAPSRARSRRSCTSTAAASWSATSTPTTRRAACSAGTPASTCSASSTARRPSTAFPAYLDDARTRLRVGERALRPRRGRRRQRGRQHRRDDRDRVRPGARAADLPGRRRDAGAPVAPAVRQGLLPHRRADAVVHRPLHARGRRPRRPAALADPLAAAEATRPPR